MEQTLDHVDYRARACLLVILKPVLTLSMASGWPIKKLSANAEWYHALKDGDKFSFFYDWLRGPLGNLLGVRCYPEDRWEFLLKIAEPLPYTHIPNGKYLEIYFSDDRDIDFTNSADQDFAYSELFRSDSDNYLLSFANDHFTETEWSGFRSAHARWPTCLVEYES